MIDQILETSKRINNNRNIGLVFYSLIEEVGELSTEISIKEGFSLKKEGDDGIIGEAVDVVLCAIDAIYINNPSVTSKEISEVIQKKLLKWETKYKLDVITDQF